MKPKVKKVKGWAVCDGKNDILNFGTMMDKPKDRIFIIYGSKESAEYSWKGFRIIPCEISYSLRPNNKIR